jgi:diketogulonate reductase-like aldo/keto reductase
MKDQNPPLITIPRIGLGMARLGGRIIPNPWKDASWMRILRSALEMGYRHFDTAELYALGYSERLLGRTLTETGTNRDDVIITTKVWPVHLTYQNLLRACEGSLRRLNTDHIDLYLIHMPNPFVKLEESFRALNQLVKEGKVKHIGVSNFNLSLLKQAVSLCETPIITNQVPYSVHDRTYEQNGVIPYCKENQIIVTAYSPLRHRQIKSDRIIRETARSHSITPHQVVLAWLISQPHIVTIPMSFSPAHLKENLDAGKVRLTVNELKQIDRIK